MSDATIFATNDAQEMVDAITARMRQLTSSETLDHLSGLDDFQRGVYVGKKAMLMEIKNNIRVNQLGLNRVNQ